jgi:hypothetical protein
MQVLLKLLHNLNNAPSDCLPLCLKFRLSHFFKIILLLISPISPLEKFQPNFKSSKRWVGNALAYEQKNKTHINQKIYIYSNQQNSNHLI